MENCARQMVSRDIYYDEVCLSVCNEKSSNQMVSHDLDISVLEPLTFFLPWHVRRRTVQGGW